MRAIALALVLLAELLPAQEPVIVRTQVRSDREVWIGERTSVDVTVLMNARPDYSPRFELPPLDGALFLQAPGSPVLGTERIAGVEYTSQQFELMLFAQREGSIDVPALGVRVALSGEEFHVMTDPVRVVARRPDGVAHDGPLITTSQLTIEERWNPKPESATVGDAFERTITIRARNVMGLAVPPAPVPRVEGLAAYPGQPTVTDRVVRGDLSSTRIDVVTLVCERPGTVAIPSLVYRWWNPESRVLEEQSLPGISFDVAALPATPTADEPEEPARDPRAAWLAVLAAAAALAALGFAWRPSTRRLGAWRERRREREAAYFRRLTAACRSGDAALAWTALLAWCNRITTTSRTPSLADLARSSGHAELVNETEDLQRALLDPRRTWSGDRLSAVLEHVRRDLQSPHARTADLPPLNRAG